MTYSQFITYITSWISGTTVGGFSKNLYIKHCLTDEIELEVDPVGSNYDFHIYITPMPITINDDNLVNYGVQIYVVGDVGLSPMIPTSGLVSARFTQFDRCITFFNAFIQQIPDDFNGVQLPITGNPVVIWDSKVDGIYFDLNIITGVDCI